MSIVGWVGVGGVWSTSGLGRMDGWEVGWIGELGFILSLLSNAEVTASL